MTADVTVLDPVQTETMLSTHRYGKAEAMHNRIAASLANVIDTDGSVYVTGMNESTLNALRTRMLRHNVALTVRKVSTGDQKGHVIRARTIRPEEQG